MNVKSVNVGFSCEPYTLRIKPSLFRTLARHSSVDRVQIRLYALQERASYPALAVHVTDNVSAAYWGVKANLETSDHSVFICLECLVA